MNLAANFSLASGRRGRLLVKKARKVADILVQLAVHHERAIAGEQVRHRRHRQFARFVGITQQQFAGRQRSPRAVGHQLALSRLVVRSTPR